MSRISMGSELLRTLDLVSQHSLSNAVTSSKLNVRAGAHFSKSGFSIARASNFRLQLVLTAFTLFSLEAAAVQNPHTAQLIQVKADTTKKPVAPPLIAPPGSDVYQAQRGDSIPSVARKNLRRSKYLTSSELAEAIRAANPNHPGVFLKSGEQIIIPGILE